ncbi:MAG: TIGR00730 family Rossman fold protein [Firmicutes bacterium]|nr:TIGR00730 family Rossman fold protein [Bacillota bacterium]
MEDFEQIFDKQFFLENERGMRILDEFIKTKDKLENSNIRNTIVMFGSARIKPDDMHEKARGYFAAAYKLANKLALWSKETFLHKSPKDKFYICTGGGNGIMEAANKGAFDAGEPTVGFNISLPFEQAANPYITKDLLFYFHYFFIRKFYFAFLAKAFVIFPGGFGTFDELFEILTLAQTRKMQPIIPFVIFGKDFFDKVLNIDMLLQHGLISESDRDLFIITDDLDEAFDHITKNILADQLLVDC